MARKLRVLVFMYNTRRYGESLGGAERRILQFSEFTSNVEIHFLERDPAIAKFYSKQPSHTAWMPNSNLRVPAQFRAMIWSLTALFSALRLDRNLYFDILISHDPEFWNILPLFFASKLICRPSVAYLHHTERTSGNIPAKTFADFYRYFKGLDYHTASSFLSAVEKILSINLLKRFNMLLSVSRTTKQDFVDRGVPESKVVVVDNGVDLTYFSAFRNREKMFDIAYLGRISPRKGLDDLIYALGKTPNRKAIVIGGGTSRHVDHYRNLTRTLPNVEFAGYLPDDEAYPLIASSRLFVFPSYEEGFGLVIGEAMALGVPVMCYDVPALVEVWGDAVRFVRTGDRQALVEEVSSLLKDDEQLKELSEKGLSFIAKYDWPNVALRETEVLRSLAGRGKP